MPVAGRDNRAYRDLSNALRRKAKRLDLPCWICGRPIDFDADWRDPMSFTYDHDDPVANGGSMRGPGKPAHRGCNSRRGNRVDHAPPTRPVTRWQW